LLRPDEEIVEEFLKDTSVGWSKFRTAYLKILNDRFKESPEQFQKLADLAMTQDLFLGCNCPTARNPDVKHCHTWLALEFMKSKFKSLPVVFPALGQE